MLSLSPFSFFFLLPHAKHLKKIIFLFFLTTSIHISFHVFLFSFSVIANNIICELFSFFCAFHYPLSFLIKLHSSFNPLLSLLSISKPSLPSRHRFFFLLLSLFFTFYLFQFFFFIHFVSSLINLSLSLHLPFHLLPFLYKFSSLSISNFLFYSSFCYSIWPRKFITTYFFSLYSPPYLLYLSLVISLSFPSLCKHLNSSDALAFHFKKSNPLLLYHFPFSFVFTLSLFSCLPSFIVYFLSFVIGIFFLSPFLCTSLLFLAFSLSVNHSNSSCPSLYKTSSSFSRFLPSIPYVPL
ncbi:unnamed protein product [Acanthosepion pharaonis]|uniref:Uncharacterized protein n=1 Tax=Acanthosepion pharaonis TaxID=158019 RepID=A0A812ARA5_ACAPH|nr:unnamed protein product [Sepia pharaonis]